MRTKIIRIGNSRGVRIPKLLLERSRLGEEVELDAEEDLIIIRPIGRTRKGWNEAFKRMAVKGDDRLIHGDLVDQTSWDNEEWQWT